MLPVSQQGEMTGLETGVGIPDQALPGEQPRRPGVLTVVLNGSRREVQCSNILMYPEVETTEVSQNI